MDTLLKGKRALITGASSGIGKAIALRFVQQGAHVALFGSDKARGEQVIQEINSQTETDALSFYEVDVVNTAHVEEQVQHVIQDFGGVDILINNAGMTRDQLLIQMREEDWDKVMTVNVKSCYNLCRVLSRHMMKARYGKIINITSIVGIKGNAGQTNYAASKAAIIGFTKSLAKELGGRNVLVNCIAPGFIETRMTEGLSDHVKKEIMQRIPLKRLGLPKDVADVAVFLACPWSDYITGEVIVVDGGMLIF